MFKYYDYIYIYQKVNTSYVHYKGSNIVQNNTIDIKIIFISNYILLSIQNHWISLKRKVVKLYKNHRNELNSECHNIKRIEYLNKHKLKKKKKNKLKI